MATKDKSEIKEDTRPLLSGDDKESGNYGSTPKGGGLESGHNGSEREVKAKRVAEGQNFPEGQNSPEVQLKGYCCIIRCLMLSTIAVGTIIIAVFNGLILDHTQAQKTFNSTTDPKECIFHTDIDGQSTQFAVGLISGLICSINSLMILLNIATFCSEIRVGWKYPNAILVIQAVLWIILVLLIIVTTILLILLSIVTFKHTTKKYQEVAYDTAECELNFTFVVTLLFWIYVIPTCILCTVYLYYLYTKCVLFMHLIILSHY